MSRSSPTPLIAPIRGRGVSSGSAFRSGTRGKMAGAILFGVGSPARHAWPAALIRGGRSGAGGSIATGYLTRELTPPGSRWHRVKREAGRRRVSGAAMRLVGERQAGDDAGGAAPPSREDDVSDSLEAPRGGLKRSEGAGALVNASAKPLAEAPAIPRAKAPAKRRTPSSTAAGR